MYKDNELIIRTLKEQDLNQLWEFIFKEDNPEWKQWDARYYPHASKSYDNFLKDSNQWVDQVDRWAIEYKGKLIGTVSYYWEHEPSLWLETGIVIYDASNRGQHIGRRALSLWISHLFNTLPLVRVGLTTWSGNEPMIKVAENLGMQMEARIRKVRLYNDYFYDSIRMGILREEWDKLNKFELE